MVARETGLAALDPPVDQGGPPLPAPQIAEEASRLAHQRTRKARLLIDAAGQFAELDRPTQKDISLFKELFYQLVGGCDKSERRQLAQLLARHPYLPRQIALFLAIDDQDIAAPVLLFSPVLNEADLVVLARRLSRDHLSVLCRRASLTPPAVRMLVRNGGKMCARLLEKNQAVLRTPELFSALSGKGDLTSREIVSSAMTAERKEHSRFHKTPTETVAAEKHSIETELLSLASRGGRLGSSGGGADGNIGAGFERQLLSAARGGDQHQVGAIIASRTGLSADTANGLITRGGVRNAATVLKGLGLDTMTAMQLMLLTDRSVAKSSRAYEQAKQLYKQLDAEKCRRFLIGLGANLADPWKGRTEGRTTPHRTETRQTPAETMQRQARSA